MLVASLLAGCSDDKVGPAGAQGESKEIAAPEAIAPAGEPGVVWLDARERQERRVSMLPGAISLDEFNRVSETLRDDHIIVYCTIGKRSAPHAARLRSDGFRARNLSAGIIAWTRGRAGLQRG